MFDFSKVVDRHGTWCTQWDYVADRFGTADLLPFTISDMDFATAPCIIEALNQRLILPTGFPPSITPPSILSRWCMALLLSIWFQN